MNKLMIIAMLVGFFLVGYAVSTHLHAEETAAERHVSTFLDKISNHVDQFMGKLKRCPDDILQMTNECLDEYQLSVEEEQDRIADEWGRRAAE